MNNLQFTIYKKASLLFIVCCLLSISAPINTLAQSIDLLWQGEGYTPPFYQGRTLWSRQGIVKVVAIPHGLGNPSSLNYKWTKNGTVLGNLNGVGVNSLSYMDTVLSRPQIITVEILSSAEEVVASSSITLIPISPFLAVYESNPLYGFMFHKEVIGNYPLKESEVSFGAFPFFFSAGRRSDGALSYSWRADSSAPEAGNLVTYRAPDDASGSSAVSVKASHAEKLIQVAQKSFLVQFGEQ